MNIVGSVTCTCGFKLGIFDYQLEEMASGTWGTIPCPKCQEPLNNKIIELYEELK